MKRIAAAIVVFALLCPSAALADFASPPSAEPFAGYEPAADPSASPEQTPAPEQTPEETDPASEETDPAAVTDGETASALEAARLRPMHISLDGSPLELDAGVCPPLAVRERTCVPVRGVFEALGAQVDWDGETNKVTVTLGGTVIVMTLGSAGVTVNGEEKTLEFPVLAIDHDADGAGTTLLPLRFVCEAAGLWVEWAGRTNTVLIYTAEPEEEPKPAYPEWCLLLVNRWNSLPQGFSVSLGTAQNGLMADARAVDDLNALLSAAYSAGLDPFVCSAYRDYNTQQALYQRKTSQYIAQGYAYNDALYQAAFWVAAPDTSEHQTGLAFDIVSRSYQILDSTQESTTTQQWLMAHSWEYGFILRYPTDKSAVTGVGYEPWHYRYVGREAAADIYSSGLCLEEWLTQYYA